MSATNYYTIRVDPEAVDRIDEIREDCFEGAKLSRRKMIGIIAHSFDPQETDFTHSDGQSA